MLLGALAQPDVYTESVVRKSNGRGSVAAATTGSPLIESASQPTILLNRSAIEWQSASYEDKVATCDLALFALWNEKALRPHIQQRITSVDDLKPYVRELVICMDAATRPDPNPYTNQRIFGDVKVHQILSASVITMGWGD